MQLLRIREGCFGECNICPRSSVFNEEVGRFVPQDTKIMYEHKESTTTRMRKNWRMTPAPKDSIHKRAVVEEFTDEVEATDYELVGETSIQYPCEIYEAHNALGLNLDILPCQGAVIPEETKHGDHLSEEELISMQMRTVFSDDWELEVLKELGGPTIMNESNHGQIENSILTSIEDDDTAQTISNRINLARPMEYETFVDSRLAAPQYWIKS